MIELVGAIAEDCRATAIFAYAEALGGARIPLPDDYGGKIFTIGKTPAGEDVPVDRENPFFCVPNVPYSRMGQIKIAIFIALSRGMIHGGDIVVFLTGVDGSGSLDTISVTEVGKELEMYSITREMETLPRGIQPVVLERVLDIAVALGAEGREGKTVGALFVLGDTEHVLPLTRQIILNPFKGYTEDERNVLDSNLEETVKELAGLDGAFLVRGDGVIETSGAFLKIAGQEEYNLPLGLGARHHAASGISSVTDSIVITVSESTGMVTVFRGGKVVVTLDRPFGFEKRRSGSSPHGGDGRKVLQ
ncbi:MAG: DNA integrity scanning protein DisA nucleotide-binding domain protein [Planctomycetota bacterium]|jgi:DNA integrity scanning protein DisA with diadenylate cyclase activity